MGGEHSRYGVGRRPSLVTSFADFMRPAGGDSIGQRGNVPGRPQTADFIKLNRGPTSSLRSLGQDCFDGDLPVERASLPEDQYGRFGETVAIDDGVIYLAAPGLNTSRKALSAAG